MKKLVIGLLAVVLLLVPVACAKETAPTPALAPMPEPVPTPLPAPESQLPFQISISPAEARYLPGQEIRTGLMIINSSPGTITIEPYPPAMWIKPVDHDESVYSVEAGTRSLDVGAGESLTHINIIWDQKDNDGKQVAPGWYEARYEYMVTEQYTSKSYTLNPAIRFLIVRPNSAVEKDMDVDRSVTADGITVTLEHIEMDALGMKVYTFLTPPGYRLPEEHPPYQYESFVINSVAEYSVDGGTVKRVDMPGGQFIKSGIRLKWDNLDPIPKDAKELTFTITRLGDWEGPWEFKVPLE